MSGEFFSKVMSISDVSTLEALREQLILEASTPELDWPSRMNVYSKVQMIIERIMQLEVE